MKRRDFLKRVGVTFVGIPAALGICKAKAKPMTREDYKNLSSSYTSSYTYDNGCGRPIEGTQHLKPLDQRRINRVCNIVTDENNLFLFKLREQVNCLTEKMRSVAFIVVNQKGYSILEPIFQTLKLKNGNEIGFMSMCTFMGMRVIPLNSLREDEPLGAVLTGIPKDYRK